MKSFRPGRLSAAVASASFAMAALLSATSANAEESATGEDTYTLDSVYVTGEKMGRDEMDTITGASVFTDEDVANANVKTLQDLTETVPNVTIGGFGGILNIRGIDGNGGGKSSFSWVGATRARTATIVDGVSRIWTGGNVMDDGLWDVEQVEVLRGPQSTAQGRSAIGGAVVVNTKAPSFTPEAAVRAGMQQANGENMYQLAGMVSAPLTDELAYRLSADLKRGDDYINYIDNDPVIDYSKDPDEIKSRDIKAKLLWKPADDFSARFDLQHQAQTGPYLKSIASDDNGDYDAPMLAEDGTTNLVTNRIGDSRLNSFISNLAWQLNEGTEASLIMSYSKFTSGYYHDQYYHSRSAIGSFRMNDWDQDTVNVEGRINFNNTGTALKGMVGISAIQDDQDLNLYYINEDGSYKSALYSGNTKTSTYSIFGEGEYALTESLALIFGGRVENENQDRDAVWGANTAALSGDGNDNTYLLPKAGVRYTLSEDHVLGADIRKGYTPGGVAWDRANASAADTVYEYDAEYVTALELSSKNMFMDKRISLNANLFYNDYSDYQAYASSGVVYGTGVTGGGIANVDEATTYGLEIESSARIGDSINLHANASVMNSKVDKYDINSDWEGNKLPYAAEQTVGLGIDYMFSYALSAGVSYKYVGSYYDDLDNDDGSDDGSDEAGDYQLINASVTYVAGDATVRGYINNLTDEMAVTADDGDVKNVLAPRTVGMTLDYAF